MDRNNIDSGVGVCSTDNVKYTVRLNAMGTTRVGGLQVAGTVLIVGRVWRLTRQR